jgi:hypothetical protein
MEFEILPLRAIIFQFFFLLIAVILEALVFQRTLELEYRTSVQYSITVNLLSTVLGWVMFFNLQPILPRELETQLISYVFFERFLFNAWVSGITPVLIITSLAMFMGTFFVKLQGLNLLEFLLKYNPHKKEDKPAEVIKEKKTERSRFAKYNAGFQVNSRAYSVLVANACSFSAILFLLFVRLLLHPQQWTIFLGN